jgi:hypothetical protein
LYSVHTKFGSLEVPYSYKDDVGMIKEQLIALCGAGSREIQDLTPYQNVGSTRREESRAVLSQSGCIAALNVAINSATSV